MKAADRSVGCAGCDRGLPTETADDGTIFHRLGRTRLVCATATQPELPRCEDVHTPDPGGYLEWHEWAARMAKTHRQRQCPRCGLWKVWVPKDGKTPPLPPDYTPTCANCLVLR